MVDAMSNNSRSSARREVNGRVTILPLSLVLVDDDNDDDEVQGIVKATMVLS